MTTLPESLECDSGPYPDDDCLQQIRDADAMRDGARWMVEMFPELASELEPYAHCEVTIDVDVFGNPEHVISFSTGGWSGCEDFINAVLGNVLLNVMYYSAWKRGGHYEFRVPISAKPA